VVLRGVQSQAQESTQIGAGGCFGRRQSPFEWESSFGACTVYDLIPESKSILLICFLSLRSRKAQGQLVYFIPSPLYCLSIFSHCAAL